MPKRPQNLKEITLAVHRGGPMRRLLQKLKRPKSTPSAAVNTPGPSTRLPMPMPKKRGRFAEWLARLLSD